MKNLKRDPMKTKSGKPRLGPLNIDQLQKMLETARPRHRAKIENRIRKLSDTAKFQS